MVECRLRIPPSPVFHYAVKRLRMLYPEDPIAWRGDGERIIWKAVSSAQWAFHYSNGECLERIIAASAALFYEIVSLHPLLDGNKRLATLTLWATLKANGIEPPENIACAALKAAAGEWGLHEIRAWLARTILPGT
ncbi:MAG: Fic family protein [Desulfurococcales archaeon]|nr:Fic family protein [Desulfurococcales archaeon]